MDSARRGNFWRGFWDGLGEGEFCEFGDLVGIGCANDREGSFCVGGEKCFLPAEWVDWRIGEREQMTDSSFLVSNSWNK